MAACCSGANPEWNPDGKMWRRMPEEMVAAFRAKVCPCVRGVCVHMHIPLLSSSRTLAPHHQQQKQHTHSASAAALAAAAAAAAEMLPLAAAAVPRLQQLPPFAPADAEHRAAG